MTTSPLATVPSAITARSAFWALVLLVPAPSVGALFGMVWWPGPAGSAIYMACKIWMFALPAVWWLWVDRQPLRWSPPRRGGFAVAGALGLLISAIIIGAYLWMGGHFIDAAHVRQVAAGNGLDRPAAFFAISAYLIFINALLEEYVYRWFIFRKFERFMASRVAIFASAAAFTIHHVIVLKAQMGWPVTILGSAGVFIGGAIWSWLYLRYQSIWPAYLCHAIIDVAVLTVGWWIIFG